MPRFLFSFKQLLKYALLFAFFYTTVYKYLYSSKQLLRIMFILKRKFKKVKGIRTYYYVVETVYINGKPRNKILRYLGTAEKILKKFMD